MATRPLPPFTTRTISTSDATASLDAIVNEIATGEEIILEREGTPTAAVISMDEYRELQGMREKTRRVELVRQFRALTQEISEQNPDLSADDVDEIAQQCSHELREERYQDAQRRLRSTPSDEYRP